MANQGIMETSTAMKISHGTMVNNGTMNGKSGTVFISGRKFRHNASEKAKIVSDVIEFSSDETSLDGEV